MVVMSIVRVYYYDDMARTGIANLPLHTGKAPRWLFEKMVELSEQIIHLICLDLGKDEFLNKISDPFWFQAFGCVLGFDWHSSGLTTTVCGAVKVSLDRIGDEIGLFMAGGKGKTAIKTPQEIEKIAQKHSINANFLKYTSRIVAKIDNAALQDGYQLYHHTIIFTDKNNWCVIQQGLNEKNSMARRYHWLKDTTKSFTKEPHKAICSQRREKLILNLVAKESLKAQSNFIDFLNSPISSIEKELNKIETLNLPKRHYITLSDLNIKRLKKNILEISDKKPSNFEQLLNIKGTGSKTLRALSLISEIVYSDKPSFKDPARYSFAHGGKDGHPYPVDLETYTESIETLKEIVNKAKIGYYDKAKALKRLSKLI